MDPQRHGPGIQPPPGPGRGCAGTEFTIRDPDRDFSLYNHHCFLSHPTPRVSWLLGSPLPAPQHPGKTGPLQVGNPVTGESVHLGWGWHVCAPGSVREEGVSMCRAGEAIRHLLPHFTSSPRSPRRSPVHCAETSRQPGTPVAPPSHPPLLRLPPRAPSWVPRPPRPGGGAARSAPCGA